MNETTLNHPLLGHAQRRWEAWGRIVQGSRLLRPDGTPYSEGREQAARELAEWLQSPEGSLRRAYDFIQARIGYWRERERGPRPEDRIRAGAAIVELEFLRTHADMEHA